MGSISGFKEYVDKDHPPCPLCGGATQKIELMKEDYPVPPISWKRSILQECVNCGAQNKDGKILRDSN